MVSCFSHIHSTCRSQQRHTLRNRGRIPEERHIKYCKVYRINQTIRRCRTLCVQWRKELYLVITVHSQQLASEGSSEGFAVSVPRVLPRRLRTQDDVILRLADVPAARHDLGRNSIKAIPQYNTFMLHSYKNHNLILILYFLDSNYVNCRNKHAQTLMTSN